MSFWIDTHCHLDAAEFDADRDAMRQRARGQGVGLCVIPAVHVHASHVAQVQQLAHQWGDAYALGIHPMCAPTAGERELQQLAEQLDAARDDPHLVAVGEIGLDFFVPELCTPQMRAHQDWLLREQLRLARQHQLPVLLHVRRSVDAVLKALRQLPPASGIAHAFVGSRQQADAFLGLGCKLGFGGAMTFDRATRLRALAAELPDDAIVLETDAPDIAPSWLYATAAERAAGQQQGRNAPEEIPRIAQVLADLRGQRLAQLQQQVLANTLQALPRLQALLPQGQS